MLARSGLIVCPCPVPVSLTSSLPSSMMPTCIHFRIKRSTLPSRTRFSIISMSWSRTMESKYAVTSISRTHPVGRVQTELGHEVIVAHAQKVRLIVKSRRKDDRLDARTLARLARIDPELLSPIQHRSAQAQLHLAEIRARAGLVSA